ncbi:MAG TPA: hypothetical protein VGO50_00015 [Pyrinomonadaceae bacterium]|nr:hypothetical protein [Pyrinomonadaceae bacterium]
MFVLNAPLLTGQPLFPMMPFGGVSPFALQNMILAIRAAQMNALLQPAASMNNFYETPVFSLQNSSVYFNNTTPSVAVGDSASAKTVSNTPQTNTILETLPDPLSDGYKVAVERNVAKAKTDPGFASLPSNLREFIGYAGVSRVSGTKENPVLAQMAQEIAAYKGVANTFKDENGWCALFANYMGLKLAANGSNPGFKIPDNFSGKVHYETFGEHIDNGNEQVGDFVFFFDKDNKDALQHVGRLVGKDDKFYYVFGGNQDCSIVNVMKIPVTEKPKDIRRWPGSNDGTASLQWDGKSALAELLGLSESAAGTNSSSSTPDKNDEDTLTWSYENGQITSSEDKKLGIVSRRIIKDDSNRTFKNPDLEEITYSNGSKRLREVKTNTNADIPCDERPKSKAVKDVVTVDNDSEIMKKIRNDDGGKISGAAFKAFLEDQGKLTTEEGVKLRRYNAETKEFVGDEFSSEMKGYCNPEEISDMTVFRYSHWDQILGGIRGLEKYKGVLTPAGAHDYNGMRIDDFKGKLLGLIRADYKKSHATSNPSDYELLIWKTGEGASI